MNRPAVRFLSRCFAPAETIALLLRRENPPSITHRVVRLERALEPRYQAWLSYENGTGANIYVAANPLRSGARKRTKESIASVRHLYIDIDTDGDARIALLRASDLVPPPTSILSTSPGKYQALWRVEGFDFDGQEQTLKRLAIVFGGDPACTDRNRVLRIPGFLNQKYNPAFKVAVEYPDNAVWTPDDFRLDANSVDVPVCVPETPSRKSQTKRSNSENDWAWICDQLAHGSDAAKLTRELPVILGADSAIAWLTPAGAERIVGDRLVAIPLRDPEIRLEIHLATLAANRSPVVSEYVRRFVKSTEEDRGPIQLRLPIDQNRAA